MQVRQRRGEIIDGCEEEMLRRPGRCLDRGGREWRLALRREEHAMHANRLRAPEQGPHVLRILERVEDDDKRRLRTLDRTGEDVLDGGEPPGIDDDRDALVA